jgi:NAD(P)-dependent dehydrogenase (short-subunit alcohol dehydrogenase family)
MSASLFAPGLLTGRVALVTGASSGLGRHFAGVLARHGATVVLAARRVERLADIANELAADLAQPRPRTSDTASPAQSPSGASAQAPDHARIHALAMDVRSGTDVERALRDVLARAGRLDIVVNNAGITGTKPALLTTDDDWSAVVDTNLSGAFRVARASAQVMADLRRGGSIINIASILGSRVAKQVPAYIAAKAGLLKLSEALALEWAPQGIRVNAIAPGYIETDLNREFLQSVAGEALGKRIPLRRFGAPPDLDAALLLLASDAGRYMTGSTLVVDGGHSLAWL